MEANEIIKSEFRFEFYFSDDVVPTKGVLNTRNNNFDEAVAWADRQLSGCPTMTRCVLTEVLFGMPIRKRVFKR